jgi:hypothetical protein
MEDTDDKRLRLNILGAPWTLNITDDPDTAGSTDFTVREMQVSRCIDDSLKDKSVEFEKLCRHEVIHAFLCESGLLHNSDWATDEEMVDWFAIQLPKINAVIYDLNEKIKNG